MIGCRKDIAYTVKVLYTNAKIYTSCDETPYASAMLVENGRILWTGDDPQEVLRGCASKNDWEVVDFDGRTVIPGFIDAHMHPMMLAEYSRQIACLPPKIHSIRQLDEAIAEAAKETPKGGWVCGWGLDEGKFEESRLPDRHDLDQGCSDKPVLIVRSCEHIRCVNSKALEIAGITKDTPDPPGGVIDRDELGEPTGILRENARDLVLPFVPKQTEEDLVDALVDLGNLLTSQGIVAIADMGNLHSGSNYEYYAKAIARGFLQRLSMYEMWDYCMDDPAFAIPKERMDGNRRLRVAGIKLIGDGSISGRTAWLRNPYRGGTGDCGMPVYSDESMERAIAFAKRCGCQIAVHAMGGRAIDRIIDRICDEADWTDGSAPFLRVEHVSEPSAHAIAKAAEKGFAFVSQPIFSYCEIETYKANLGETRITQLYPYRTELEQGVSLCFSTDAPATSWAVPSDPFTNIKAAVTRSAYDGSNIGRDQRISVETAIKLYTKNAAEICGFHGLGCLKEGYLADFAVLSEDIFAIDPARIDQVQVAETYIEGIYCNRDTQR